MLSLYLFFLQTFYPTNVTMTFDKIVENIQEINNSARVTATGAINRSMTLRNWLIGYYIFEFEQNGKERAEYGTYLLKKLEEQINERGLNTTFFKLCRQFYLTYPQIGATLSHQFGTFVLPGKGATLSHQLDKSDENALSSQPDQRFTTKPELLISRLLFSHIREIMTIDDSFERFFYEFECIKCGWSERERKAAYLAASTYFTLQKMGEEATSETGEGTLLEDATINVVVDGVTPSTGMTGTIGVSVDEKA